MNEDFDTLMKNVNNKDFKYENNIGVCYFNGTGVEKDYKKAVEWFNKAAKKGCEKSYHNLGKCYSEGCGVEIDYKKALEFFNKYKEDMNIINTIGSIYYNGGYGVEKDYKKAFEYFSKAAEKGCTYSYYNLGFYYNKDQDYNKALEWLIKAYNNGRKESSQDIINIYLKKKDMENVFYWWNKNPSIFNILELINKFEDKDVLLNTFMSNMLTNNQQMKEKINELEIEIKYKPGGDGYEDCKKEFEGLQK